MIDIEKGKICQDDVVEDIISFEVWWRTHKGLVKRLPIALQVCQEADLDPAHFIRPVVLAVSDTMTEEMQ